MIQLSAMRPDQHDAIATHTVLIETAWTPLQEHISDLEQDWEPRGEVFWTEVLDALHSLRAALTVAQSCTEVHYLTAEDMRFANSCIDTVGIAVTSYRDVCNSYKELHLRQRQAVLCDLRQLAKAVQQVLTGLAQQQQQQKVQDDHQ